MNEKIIACSNCKQPIAESKYLLHEIYCSRNNIKCVKCGLFYDKNDPDSHEEEYHKKEKCEYCFLESEDLKKHKCTKKPKQCMHCDLYFPSDQLFQHENQCGSRTQKCDICNTYVIMREYQNHVITCMPKPKPESTYVQTKPSYQEIYDKPNYSIPQIDDKIDQQKFYSKKESSQIDAQTQGYQKYQAQQQQKQYQQQQQQQQQQFSNKPIGSGYKYAQAAGETKSQYQLKDDDKNKQKDNNRPPSSSNQTGSKMSKQPITQGTQPKQQTSQTYNQRQQNSTQKEDITQFDNQYEKQQYMNRQSQQSQPQPQQQIKQQAPVQKSLESYKNSQYNKPQPQSQNNKPDLRRPDTAIAREIQKQMELEEEYGISSEEYLQQQLFDMSLKDKQEKFPQKKKEPLPQPVVPIRVPQKVENQEFDFGDISEEEKLLQQQILESLNLNQKKR